VLRGDKVLRAVSGRLLDGDAAFSGYEMHVGRTTGPQKKMGVRGNSFPRP
jgi:adenosylcobyric acid synthase